MIADISISYWLATAVLAIGTLLGFAGLFEAVSSNGRHQGIFPNPNLLGLVAVVALTIGLGIAAEKRHPLIWASLLIPAASVLLSQSRTAMLAASIGIVWALVRGYFVRIVPGVLMVIIFIGYVRVAGINLFGNLLRRFTAMEGGDLLNDRTSAWEDVIWNIQQYPLGVGWAATRKAMEQRYLAGYTDSGIFTMHNSWFQIGNELGWMGLPAIAFLLFATWRIAFTAKPTGFGLGMVATTVAGSLTHLTESAMFGIGGPYPYLFWFAVLAAVATFEPSRGAGEPSNEQRGSSRFGVRS